MTAGAFCLSGCDSDETTAAKPPIDGGTELDGGADASTDGGDSDGGTDPQEFTVRGLGGGGGIFVPSVSPYDETFMLLACDMGGVYRSQTGGDRWDLIHYQQLASASDSTHPAYFTDRVFWHVGSTLAVTHDAATSWNVMNGGPWGAEAIGYLTAVPGSPDVLLVGTDSALWRTTDDGGTFTSVLAERPREVVTLDGQLVTVSGDNTLQTSTDRGATWTAGAVTVDGSPLAQGQQVTTLTGGATGTASVLFGVTQAHGTIRSTNGGASWTTVAPFASQNTLQMAPTQTQVAYAANVGGTEVWCTHDGGDSWEICFRLTGTDINVEPSWVQTELHWGYYITAHGFFASRANPDLAMLATQGDLYVTRDGGVSWEQGVNEALGVLSGDPAPRYRSIGLEVTSSWGYLVDPHDPDREYIAYTDVGFARTVDRATTWSYSATGCNWTNTFYDVVFDPDVPDRMYAATSNRHDIPHWTHITVNDPNVSSHRGGVCISEDQAESWTSASSGLPDLPCTTIAIDPTSPTTQRTLYAGIFGQGVYKSTNGGQSWELKSSGLGNPGNLHIYRVRRHPATGVLYALITALRDGNSFTIPGGVWRSDDGAESWTDISGSLGLVWATNLALDPASDQVLFVTAASAPGHSQGGVYRTLDGGGSWEHVLTDAEVAQTGGASYDHFMSVAIHPDDGSVVYAGSSGHGLWLSQDGGDAWQHWQSFPFSNVQSINVDPRDSSRLVMTTFGGGVWEGPHLPW